MAVVRLATALCILATFANGCSQHAEAVVADNAAKPVRGRSLLKYTTTHADGTRILRKCGVASTSALKKQAIQNGLHPYIAARVANAERTMPIVVNVYVTINRNGGAHTVSPITPAPNSCTLVIWAFFFESNCAAFERSFT